MVNLVELSIQEMNDAMLTWIAHRMMQAGGIHGAHRDAEAVDAVRGFEVGHRRVHAVVVRAGSRIAHALSEIKSSIQI